MYCEVKMLSEMRGAFRLDAEFWNPEYEGIEACICRGPHTTLVEASDWQRKGIFSILASDYTDNGVPFYRCSNIGSILTRDSNLAHISAARNVAEGKTCLRYGDVILAKTGMEAASIVTEMECNISQDLVGIRVRPNVINPFYLATFLNSRFGILQMRRWFQGQVQMHLALPDVRGMLIPIPNPAIQEGVEKFVLAALAKRGEAESLYRAAESAIIKSLALEGLNLSPSLFYERPCRDVAAAHRTDGDFFMPRHYRLVEAIRKTGAARRLGDFVEHCERGLQPEYNDEGEVLVVNTKHLGPQFVAEDYEHCALDAWARQEKARLQQYDVLFYSTGAYIGRTNCWFETTKAIGSNHVTIIRPRTECNPVYLSLFLNSAVGLMQTDRHAHGSAQREIYPSDIREFTVWLPSIKKQEQITGLVLEAKSARDESHRLLEEARKMVEDAIEGEGH